MKYNMPREHKEETAMYHVVLSVSIFHVLKEMDHESRVATALYFTVTGIKHTTDL